MKTFYMAHRLGTDMTREGNLVLARQWYGFFIEHYELALIADWVITASVWTEDEVGRMTRPVAMAMNKELVLRSDGVIMCGERRSAGMIEEAEWARNANLPVVEVPLQRYPPAKRDAPLRDPLFPQIEQMLALVGVTRRIWKSVD